MCSADIRPFSKGDTENFLNTCFPGGYEIVGFGGAQFYPFLGKIARVLADLMPTLAFTILFLLRKVKPYAGEFVAFPTKAELETNFWTGQGHAGQY